MVNFFALLNWLFRRQLRRGILIVFPLALAVSNFMFLNNVFFWHTVELDRFFSPLAWLLILILPVLAGGAFWSRGDRWLLSQPLTESALFFATWITQLAGVFLMEVAMLPMVATLRWLAPLDLRQCAVAMLGLLMWSAVVLALSLALATIWQSQVLIVTGSVGISGLLLFCSSPILLNHFSPWLQRIIWRFSAWEHLQPFFFGQIQSVDLLYFLGVGALLLTVAARMLTPHKRVDWFWPKHLMTMLVGIALFGWVLIFAEHRPVSIDVTERHRNSLAPSTRTLLKNLENPVTLTLYSSSNLPAALDAARHRAERLMLAYRRASEGRIQVVLQNTDRDKKVADAATAAGIPAIPVSVVEGDRVTLRTLKFGLTMTTRGRQTVIPVIRDLSHLEYEVSTLLSRLVAGEAPELAVLYDFKQSSRQDFFRLHSEIGRQFVMRYLRLGEAVPNTARALLVLAPSGWQSEDWNKVSDYLGRSGQVLLLVDTAVPDAEMRGHAVSFAADTFLRRFGLSFSPQLLVSTPGEMASFSDGQTTLTVPYPFFLRPYAGQYVSHPALTGYGQLVFSWLSPIHFEAVAGVGQVPMILGSSHERAVSIQNLSPQLSLPTQGEKSNSGDPLVLLTEIRLKMRTPARMITIGSASFISDQILANFPENLPGVMGILGWLAQSNTFSDIDLKMGDAVQIRKLTPELSAAVKWLAIFFGPAFFSLAVWFGRKR